VNCAEARERLLAEPAARPAELAAHLAACPECAALATRLGEFDAKLKRALAVPVPPPRALPLVTPVRARRMPAWFALAAGGLVVAVALGLVLSVYPRMALASAVVRHVEGEPGSWATTQTVADAELEQVLRRSGASLAGGAPRVTYAVNCRFRGHVVPHLIVQTAAGPMTVMLLPEEHVSRAMPIDEDGFRGLIVPAGRGALAVLERGAGAPGLPAAVAAEAVRAFRFAD